MGEMKTFAGKAYSSGMPKQRAAKEKKEKRARSYGSVIRATIAVYTLVLLILAVFVVRLLFGADVFKTANFFVDENENGKLDNDESIVEISVKGGEFRFLANADPLFIGKWYYTYEDGTKVSNWYFNHLNLPFLLPDAPQKENYCLLGWYTVIDGEEVKIYQDFFSCSTKFANLAIYPKYEEVKFKTAVTLNANGVPVSCYITGIENNVYNLTKLSIPSQMVVSYQVGENTRTKTVPVVGITANAFSGIKSLTNLTIPSSVVNVVKSAFSGCTNIAVLDAPASALPAISKNSLRSVTINSGTAIPDNALKDAKHVASIVIPESITTIGVDAFYNSGITTINIPAAVKTIGVGAFAYCASLSSIVVDENNDYYMSTNNNTIVRRSDKMLIAGCKSTNISDVKITGIANYAFAGCTGLKELFLSDTVKSIGEQAFIGCTSLKEIYLAKVDTIADNAFSGCTSLDTLNIAADNANYVVKNGCLITNTQKLILALKDVKIGEEIVEFNYDYAFENGPEVVYIDNAKLNLSIANINFDYVNQIVGNLNVVKHFVSRVKKSVDATIIKTEKIDTLDRTSYLRSLTIGDNVKEIKDNAFAGCYALVSIVIGKDVTEISSSGFVSCNKLESLSVEAGNTVYTAKANCIIKDGTVVLACKNSDLEKSGATKIGEYAFFGEGITKIVIPENIDEIAKSAFYNCTALTEIVIIDADKSFAEYTSDIFDGCKRIAKVTLPAYDIACVPKDALATVEFSAGDTIPAEALKGCTTLTSVIMPYGIGITAIGESAFEGCIKLTSVELPFEVTSIGEKAFFKSGLTAIYLYDTVTSVGANAFGYCADLKDIRVSSYIGEGLDKDAFKGCEAITTAELPTYALGYINLAKVESIIVNDYVYGATLNAIMLEGAENLKTLSIGRGVTAIVNGERFNTTGITLAVDENNETFELINGKIVLRSENK